MFDAERILETPQEWDNCFKEACESYIATSEGALPPAKPRRKREGSLSNNENVRPSINTEIGDNKNSPHRETTGSRNAIYSDHSLINARDKIYSTPLAPPTYATKPNLPNNGVSNDWNNFYSPRTNLNQPGTSYITSNVAHTVDYYPSRSNQASIADYNRSYDSMQQHAAPSNQQKSRHIEYSGHADYRPRHYDVERMSHDRYHNSFNNSFWRPRSFSSAPSPPSYSPSSSMHNAPIGYRSVGHRPRNNWMFQEPPLPLVQNPNIRNSNSASLADFSEDRRNLMGKTELRWENGIKNTTMKSTTTKADVKNSITDNGAIPEIAPLKLNPNDFILTESEKDQAKERFFNKEKPPQINPTGLENTALVALAEKASLEVSEIAPLKLNPNEFILTETEKNQAIVHKENIPHISPHVLEKNSLVNLGERACVETGDAQDVKSVSGNEISQPLYVKLDNEQITGSSIAQDGIQENAGDSFLNVAALETQFINEKIMQQREIHLLQLEKIAAEAKIAQINAREAFATSKRRLIAQGYSPDEAEDVLSNDTKRRRVNEYEEEKRSVSVKADSNQGNH